MLGDVSFTNCVTLCPGTFMLGDVSFTNCVTLCPGTFTLGDVLINTTDVMDTANSQNISLSKDLFKTLLANASLNTTQVNGVSISHVIVAI